VKTNFASNHPDTHTRLYRLRVFSLMMMTMMMNDDVDVIVEPWLYIYITDCSVKLTYVFLINITACCETLMSVSMCIFFSIILYFLHVVFLLLSIPLGCSSVSLCLFLSLVLHGLKESFDQAIKRNDVKAIVVTGIVICY